MWQKFFILKGIVPGPVVTHKYGKIDFSRDDLSVPMLKDLYEDNFPYLDITPAGLKELYSNPSHATETTIQNTTPPDPVLSDDSVDPKSNHTNSQPAQQYSKATSKPKSSS